MELRKELNIQIKSRQGKPLLVDLIYQTTGKAKPVIIFVHGFKSFKDWGCWNLVAEKFADGGFFFVKFNFSHNGTTPENLLEFDDLNAFGNNNFTKELDDLDTVIEWVMSNEAITQEANRNHITLIGHSRGGGISIIKTKEDNRIKALVTWAAIAWFDRMFPDDLDTWEEAGVHYTINARTGQKMPLYYQLAEDYYENESRLDILDACIRIRTPFMIIHGTKDEAVPVSDAFLLKRYAANAELILIENGTHTFGAKHPWNESKLPDEMAVLIEQTIGFIK